MPSLRIVLFTPRDVEPPPRADVKRRLTQFADYTEAFFDRWLRRWGYPPATAKLFVRDGDGTAEVLFVKGDRPVVSGRYKAPGFEEEVINKAAIQYKVPRNLNVWWIFVYLGDPPARFPEYGGKGNHRDGGWALVNYSTAPGEVRPGSDMAGGLNQEITLKGCIHELGHALGLPHIGPNPRKGLGNSLMGPQTFVYAKHGFPDDARVYMTEPEAALLWKHPLFSGTARDRAVVPRVTLRDFRASFDRERRQAVVSGKLTTNVPAHSVVVIDDMEKKPDPYWTRGYAARLGEDGTFRVTIDEPVTSDGRIKILFCFQNGAITGDGKGLGIDAALVKPYRLVRDGLQFSP
jgi:hypothetical protein